MRNIITFIAALAVSAFAHAASFGPAAPDETLYGDDGTRYDVVVSSYVADSQRIVGAMVVHAYNGKYSATFRVLVQGDHCRAGGGVAIVEFDESLQSRPWSSNTDEPLDLVVGIICYNMQQ